jgi:hypothetical protein
LTTVRSEVRDKLFGNFKLVPELDLDLTFAVDLLDLDLVIFIPRITEKL